jgi:hypothetical protein
VIRRALLGALVGLGSIVLIGVGPAAAAFPPVATVDNPVEGAKWTGGAVTDFHVTGHADTDDSNYVTSVSAVIAPTDDGPKTYSKLQAFPNRGETGAGPHQNFDLQIFPDLNGKYSVTVQPAGKTCFITCGQETAGPAVVRNITVAVPPKVPTGAKATLTDGVATIVWSANNTEGDLLGYLVEQSAAGDSYKCLTMVAVSADAPATYKATSDLKTANSGEYKWRVRAVRKSGPTSILGSCSKPGTGLTSLPSSTVQVTWDNPTPVTTTTTKPAGGGGTTTTTTKVKRSGGGGGSISAPKTNTPNLSALGGLSAGTGSSPSPRRAAEADPGFNDFLPFPSGSDPGDDGGAAAGNTALPAAADDNGGRTTLLFIAAGLLATVLSMHVLWLKAQVDRMPLEPLTPEDIPLA